jgi:hypothetical protein
MYHEDSIANFGNGLMKPLEQTLVKNQDVKVLVDVQVTGP